MQKAHDGLVDEAEVLLGGTGAGAAATAAAKQV